MIRLLRWLFGFLDKPYTIEEMMLYDFLDD